MQSIGDRKSHWAVSLNIVGSAPAHIGAAGYQPCQGCQVQMPCTDALRNIYEVTF